MKPAGKVALLGLGLLALVAVPAFTITGFGLFNRAKKLSPEEEKSWQEALARRGPLPKMMPAPDGSGRMVPVVDLSKMMPAPDGSGRMVPVVGSVANPRGHYS